MLSTCTPLPALFGEPPLAPMVLIWISVELKVFHFQYALAQNS